MHSLDGRKRGIPVNAIQYRHKPVYTDALMRDKQKYLDENVQKLSIPELMKFLTQVNIVRSTVLGSTGIDRLNPLTVSKSILIPRQELYFFILYNWIKHIFIPSLGGQVSVNLFVFGIGRIFSSYNRTGVQHCTDADLNFVVSNSVSQEDCQKLREKVNGLVRVMAETFNIIVEVNHDFTVRSVKDVSDKIRSDNPKDCLEAILFYKCNEPGMFVLHDNSGLRESVFSRTRDFPDSLFFTNFIGVNISKPTLTRLRSEQVMLPLLPDNGNMKVSVSSVVGSKSFKRNARRLALIHPDLYPGEWFFSIKYTVNRVYDFVSALLFRGYSLPAIGFSGEDDFDYKFLCNAHALMLYLQELTHIKLNSYNDAFRDYSYMSSHRFEHFIKVSGDSFFKDFDEMVIKGGLLREGQRKQYVHLKTCIAQNKRDRVLDSTDTIIRSLAEKNKLRYDVEHHDKMRKKVCVPYTWSDLGYFVFDSITERIVSILEIKIVPMLESLGMPEREIALYRKMLNINGS